MSSSGPELSELPRAGGKNTVNSMSTNSLGTGETPVADAESVPMDALAAEP